MTQATYTVTHRDYCVLIQGSLPARVLAAIGACAPEGSVLDADAARVLGVTFVIGRPEDIQALRDASTTSN